MNEAVRVIGIGSPFGADQLGWRVVDALRADQSLPGIGLLQCRQPSELPQLLAGCKKAVLVDAALAGREPGTLLRLGIGDLPAAGLAVSSHGFGVSEAVQLAGVLGSLPAGLVVLALETGSPEQPLLPEWIERLAQAVRLEIRPADT